MCAAFIFSSFIGSKRSLIILLKFCDHSYSRKIKKLSLIPQLWPHEDCSAWSNYVPIYCWRRQFVATQKMHESLRHQIFEWAAGFHPKYSTLLFFHHCRPAFASPLSMVWILSREYIHGWMASPLYHHTKNRKSSFLHGSLSELVPNFWGSLWKGLKTSKQQTVSNEQFPPSLIGFCLG